jgi:hypothetical protein
VKYDLGALAAGGGWAGVERDICAACGEFPPAFFAGDLFEAEYVSVEFAHDIDLASE